MARRYEFYFRVAKQYLTNEGSEVSKILFLPGENKFISSSRRVMFFSLYRQKDIDKIIEGNYRNYVIDKLTCEIMENKPLGSRMWFLWILRVVYFPVKHSCLYNNIIYFSLGFSCCPYYRGVRYSGVSARRELTPKWTFLLQISCHIPDPWALLGNSHKEHRRNRNKHKFPNIPYPP